MRLMSRMQITTRPITNEFKYTKLLLQKKKKKQLADYIESNDRKVWYLADYEEIANYNKKFTGIAQMQFTEKGIENCLLYTSRCV